MQFEIVLVVKSQELTDIVQQLTAINTNLTALVTQGSQDAADEAMAVTLNQSTAALKAALPATAG
jgi:hypothetical protein